MRACGTRQCACRAHSDGMFMCCRLIECMSAASLNWDARQGARFLTTLEQSLEHADIKLQTAALAALHAFARWVKVFVFTEGLWRIVATLFVRVAMLQGECTCRP